MNNPCIRKGAATVALLSGLAWVSPAVAQQPPQPPQPSPLPTQPLPPPAAPKQPAFMPEVVVTATGRPEEVSQIAGTMQVITQDRIAHSTAKSVTELLAENSVGFMSEWTAGQTSINIRGAATEGQGRDFKSQVLILINGHRAGTANVSKLSIADVERIEIVRGPSSVVYGSQNMGGVINIILKTGRTAEPGTLHRGGRRLVDAVSKAGRRTAAPPASTTGTSAATPARAGRLSGAAAGRSSRTPPGRATAAPAPSACRSTRTIASTSRSAATASTTPASAARRQRLRLRQPLQPVGRPRLQRQDARRPRQPVRSRPTTCTTSTTSTIPPAQRAECASPRAPTIDRNRRQLDIVGTRFQPRYKPWTGNELLLGIDWERSYAPLRPLSPDQRAVATSSRRRTTTRPKTSSASMSRTRSASVDDRVTVRGGVRQTYGKHGARLDAERADPAARHQQLLRRPPTRRAPPTRATDWLNTARRRLERLSRADRHRARRELHGHADRHHDLRQSEPAARDRQQIEAGATANWDGGRLDLALFQNIISNRITAVTHLVDRRRGRPAAAEQSRRHRRAGPGVPDRCQRHPHARTQRAGRPGNWNVFGNGYYNFKMIDYGAPPAFGTDTATRINQYEAAIGTRFGQSRRRDAVELPAHSASCADRCGTIPRSR